MAHFLLLMSMDSVEAVRVFAGLDHERARCYPEDGDYLLEREPFVSLYEELPVVAEPVRDGAG